MFDRASRAGVEFRRSLARRPNTDAPRTAAELYQLGADAYRKRKTKDALGHFARALEADPAFFRAAHFMGMIQYERDELDAAIESFRRVVKINPQYAKSHNGLGNCYRDKGMLMESFQAFKTAARLEPKDAMYHHNLGLTAMDIGFYDMAVLELESSQNLDPRNEDVQYDLGAAYYLSADLERAAEQYRRFLERSPDSPRAAEIRAKIKALRRRMASAPRKTKTATPASSPNDVS